MSTAGSVNTLNRTEFFDEWLNGLNDLTLRQRSWYAFAEPNWATSEIANL